MTQEDKQLLLKDLCARLPYGVCVHIRYKEGEPCYGELTPKDIQWFIDSKIEEIKPYLRPMSSMTEEEIKEYNDIVKNTIDFYNCPKSEEICFFITPINWLNAHHFDYRGLIEKDLAIEEPEGMYDTSQKWTTIRSELKENENGQIVGGLKL